MADSQRVNGWAARSFSDYPLSAIALLLSPLRRPLSTTRTRRRTCTDYGNFIAARAENPLPERRLQVDVTVARAHTTLAPLVPRRGGSCLRTRNHEFTRRRP